jgi:hypothetical protein
MLNEKQTLTDTKNVAGVMSEVSVFFNSKDSEYQVNKQDFLQIIRVGNEVKKLIAVPDTLGRPHTTLVGRTREVIKERYGNAILTQAPY